MIDENTPDKLAEIIRDTWPQLYHLKTIDNENKQGEKTCFRASDTKGSQ